MLGGGNHVLILGAADRGAHHDAGQKRVLPGIFELAAAAGIAHQIGAAAEHDVEAALRRLPPQQRAGAVGGAGIETGGHCQAGWQGDGRVAGADVVGVRDAEAGITLLQRRNAEPGDAGDVAGGADGALGFGVIRVLGVGAVEHGELFWQRHRGEELGWGGGGGGGAGQGKAKEKDWGARPPPKPRREFAEPHAGHTGAARDGRQYAKYAYFGA
jgi:hypothetical protein